MPLELTLSNPVTWLVLSILVAAAGSTASWLLVPALRRSRPPLLWDVAAWLVCAVFALLFPALAWQHGAFSLYNAGIGEIDWISSLTDGALPAVGLCAGLVLIALLQGRADVDAPLARPWPLALVNAVLLEIHWAFYRQGTIALLDGLTRVDLPAWARPLMTIPPGDLVYWGGWLSLVVLLVEWLAIPRARHWATQPGNAARWVRQVLYAVSSVAIFVLSRNIWLCLLSHVVAEGIIEGRLLRQPATRRAVAT